MRLREIAEGISVNPEKVIVVKIVGEQVIVVVEELTGEYSDLASLMYSVEYESNLSYEDTIKELERK